MPDLSALEAAEVNPAADGWRPVGTVVGNAGTAEYTFILKQYQGRVGDIVALRMEIPEQGERRQSIYVWARITDIRRYNPFFPYEAAQEIAGEGISLEDTVLSGTADQLEANALILGATSEHNLTRLHPLTYPVKPAAKVYHPPAEAIRQLLVGARKEGEKAAEIGSLIARGDVEVEISAPKLVSRHLAILAMTGGGKTVAARRIIRELIKHRYPLLILDPHGDYIGLWKCRELLKEESADCDIKLFYPELLIQESGEALVEKIIGQMTDGLTEPQADQLRNLFNKVPAKDGKQVIDYIDELLKRLGAEIEQASDRRQLPTMYALRRALNIVLRRLQGMRNTSEMMRQSKTLQHLDFEPLPNPFSEPENIIRPGQVSILYLGGYDHVTQCSIAAITLETLFGYRTDLSGRIAPFMTVVEEAHTFIPSSREGSTQDAVTLPVVRQIITEGRKFGTGLMLISQRPSRLDETIVSQCNSFLILRLVNPRDQNFVRSIMENLSESDARMIPGFGPGQGIISGQVVRFPLPVSIRMDQDLLASEIGDEDFFEQAESWRPDEHAEIRKARAARTGAARANRTKRKSSGGSNGRGRRTAKSG